MKNTKSTVRISYFVAQEEKSHVGLVDDNLVNYPYKKHHIKYLDKYILLYYIILYYILN